MKSVPARYGLALAFLVLPLISSAYAGTMPPNGPAAMGNTVLVAAQSDARHITHRSTVQAAHHCRAEGMFWSAKEHKCTDAHNKAPQGEPSGGPAWESNCMLGRAGC